VSEEQVIRYPLWERQDFESDEQWAAFQNYRNTPPAVRALDRVSAEVYVKRAKVEKWAKLMHWAERAREFDRWCDQQQAHELSRSEALHETRRAHLRLLGLFSKILGDELETILKQQAERREQGATYSILKPHEIARSLRDTVVLTRLLMGESTENVSLGGKLADLSDEELEVLEKIHAKKDRSILTSGQEIVKKD
jgi:hypothetical protein